MEADTHDLTEELMDDTTDPPAETSSSSIYMVAPDGQMGPEEKDSLAIAQETINIENQAEQSRMEAEEASVLAQPGPSPIPPSPPPFSIDLPAIASQIRKIIIDFEDLEKESFGLDTNTVLKSPPPPHRGSLYLHLRVQVLFIQNPQWEFQTIPQRN